MIESCLADRLLELARSRPGLAALKALDAWFLGPALARPIHTTLPHLSSARLKAALSSPEPIHWLRPGGMGDWAVLAPFIEGVRAVRNHPEDTLWVTEAALPLACAFHRPGGLQVKAIGVRSLLEAQAPGLLIQTELFHPMAWILAALLRPKGVAGPPLPDPRTLDAGPSLPMHQVFQALHPGVAQVFPAPPAARSERLVCFPQGVHASRRLPGGLQQHLLAAGFSEVAWLGPWPGGEPPAGWSLLTAPLGPMALLTLVAEAGAVLSPDSGPFHLARLLGTPALAYFTSGDWLQWGWPEPGRATVRSTFPCAACTRMALPARCPYGYGCVKDGDAGLLLDALRALLPS